MMNIKFYIVLHFYIDYYNIFDCYYMDAYKC